MKPLVDRLSLILVPQGAEARSVRRGLQAATNAPLIVSIPAGPEPVSRFLRQHLADSSFLQPPDDKSPAVLLLGLCGGLTPTLKVGDIVLYDACLSAREDRQSAGKPETCDPVLTQAIAQSLGHRVQRGTGLTCDRVLCSAQAKQQWGQHTGAVAVDMEGWPVLNLLNQAGIATAMLRIVSDDCHHDLPDLNHAINPAGNLRLVSLTRAMLLKPRAAMRLVRGSLAGLQQLQAIATALCHQS